MLLSFRYINILILIFFILSNSSLAKPKNQIDCKNYISSPNKFSKINIETLNSRSFNKNLLEIILHTQSNEWITDDFKKRYSALIKYQNENQKCKIKSKVRFHGDLKDHIKIKDGEIFSSVDLSLDEGNFFGRTKFKLYLPETRFNDSEIFVTTLLRQLNFLSPITFKTEIFFNQKKIEYLVQEKISKELLENQKTNESYIFEQDELFMVQGSVVDFSRIENSNFLNKSDNHLKKGIQLINYVNHDYFEKSLRNLKNSNYQSLNMSNIIHGNSESKKKFSIFSTLLLILNAEHGLSPDDRKFYFNKHSRNFEPIYYDGLSYNFLDLNNSSKDFLFKLKNYNLPYEALTNISTTKELISSIDLKSFQNNLNLFGLNFSLNKIENIFLELNNRLDYLSQIDKNEYSYEKLNFEEDYKTFLKELDNYNYLYVWGNLTDGFIICEDFNKECQKINLTRKEINKLLEQKLVIDKKRVIYVFDDATNKNLIQKKNYDTYLKKTHENFKILHNKDVKIEIDEDIKEINITQLSKKGKVIFTEGTINDYKINFFGDEKNNFYEKNLITGCLNFYKINFQDTEINSLNSFFCEDAINIINSTGFIKKISSKNSKNDAIDFDFSDLSIGEIYIENTMNDCVDFSYGKYEIQTIVAKNCGDKTISVGEKSKIIIQEVFSKNSNYGFVSKDGSKAKVYNLNVENTKICLAAYNKKQEHSGGNIIIENFKCSSFFFLEQTDDLSKITIVKKQIQNQLNKNDILIYSEKKTDLFKDIRLYDSNKEIVNAIIEIPKKTKKKWEYSIINKRIELDFFMGQKRILNSEYFFDYGFLPQTLFPISSGGDGDPLDIIIISNNNFQPGDRVQVKPIKIIEMYDDGSFDHKIIGIDIKNMNLDKNQLEKKISEIISWLEKYKGNHRIKVVKILGLEDANKFINESNKKFKKSI